MFGTLLLVNFYIYILNTVVISKKNYEKYKSKSLVEVSISFLALWFRILYIFFKDSYIII